ncbi:MAG: SGNH/GDSL hydrolase family protein [Planctomycetes bacterium]|jgi:lysophospholipase L1-like esterase|nr:SGNH/GDSL hydrolase family protein [Planctomycetota bacterium]
MTMTPTHPTEAAPTRRCFLGQAAAAASLASLSTLVTAGCSGPRRQIPVGAPGGLLQTGAVVLFQGDSITDAGRDRNRENNANEARALGTGYAFLAASRLLSARPEAGLKIYNRGISGNKVFQLAERWDKDCLGLKPGLVSILIGVNDIWHTLNGKYEGTVEVYERDYRTLLTRTQKELPGVRLVVCEPFVLRCGAVTDKWFPEFDGYRAAARRVATDFQATFVPFQAMFDQAVRSAPPKYWAADGVHPTIAGAALMAQTWCDLVARAKA